MPRGYVRQLDLSVCLCHGDMSNMWISMCFCLGHCLQFSGTTKNKKKNLISVKILIYCKYLRAFLLAKLV